MSADGEGQEDGSSSSDLATWLAHWRLSSLLPALEEFGASHPIDLLDLEQEDVASLSMRKLELKRWGKGMEDLKEAILAAPQPPSPSLQILSSAVQKGRSPEAGDAQRDGAPRELSKPPPPLQGQATASALPPVGGGYLTRCPRRPLPSAARPIALHFHS